MTTVLFDMDGIVLEGPRTDPQVYADAADAAVADLEIDPSPAQREDFRRHDAERIRTHCEELGVDPDRFWELKERYASQGTHDRLRAGEREIYDDVATIRDLADRTTVGLVTNNRHETAEFVADYVGIDFDAVRGRDPTFEGYERRKPDSYYIEDALATLGVADGVYVGDSHKDVAAGQAAGLETVYVRRDHNRDHERPPNATVELEGLTGLPAALESL
ncbi:HAD-superfamily hydrolase [Natrinema pellirubrum DSM 15624]|uniref:HAD-superfamily hydrolase n=1 Tax=Natrinema pellirubrum (strain DSM 15624 / CIP 106293 / JCM 10476 / NCIMB 786 / 157) TaxID=797303 RepID=L0JRT8_NATP1|nr:HAD-IA family hydrolase [Natrinema pellirubrum]AGB33101.1 haloacid dehalogenase superfamily enzyme, subfamily IA [Natrinema pellirubrum DSM 15624]ELY71766.1 HAD-superfamily hydrolase [Natrinema pellirubrum DSM 15624]